MKKMTRVAKHSPGADVKEESAENLNNKDSDMTDKKKGKAGKKAPVKKVGNKKPAAKAKNNNLPHGVTTKPQDEEHMDLSLIEDSSALVKAYLQTSGHANNPKMVKGL